MVRIRQGLGVVVTTLDVVVFHIFEKTPKPRAVRAHHECHSQSSLSNFGCQCGVFRLVQQQCPVCYIDGWDPCPQNHFLDSRVTAKVNSDCLEHMHHVLELLVVHLGGYSATLNEIVKALLGFVD